MKSIGIVVIAVWPVLAQVGNPISAERIREHDRFLSSDLLEGRAVGARGGDLATAYIASQFALAGAKPAGEKGSYFQKVPLVGIEPGAESQLSAAAGGNTVSFQLLNDFVGVSEQQKPETQFEGEAVFVGHGISAPEWKWDDFKGVDVRGKVVVLFTNEPASNDPKFFDGRALTYYGRWIYKYEEATRRGALAVLIIHTTATAGYGWDVVRSSWGRQQSYVALPAGQHALGLAGWITREAGQRLLALAGKNVDDLLAAAESRDFRPIPLGIRIRGDVRAQVHSLDTRNVAAVVPWSDSKLKDEVVIFTAHWDHLGIGEAVNGDPIYNGAIDNATGCGLLIEMARVWANTHPAPKRSIYFSAVAAEEQGLLGSLWLGQNPPVPAGRIALGINFDAIPEYCRVSDVQMNGVERTTFFPTSQRVTKAMGIKIVPDQEPEQGHYYRSDHFSLGKVGIPAFSVDAGQTVVGKPAGYGKAKSDEYREKHYHQPSDEIQPDWDWGTSQELAQLGYWLGWEAANSQSMPNWIPGDEFRGVRDASLAASGTRRSGR